MAGWAYSKVAHVSSSYDKEAWAWWSGKGDGWAQVTQTGCMKNAVSCNSTWGLIWGKAPFQVRTFGIFCDPLCGTCEGGRYRYMD